jgi:hypothetical protein
MPFHRLACLATGAAALALTGAAQAAGNSVNDQFSALTPEDRGASIARILSTNGRACNMVQREMFQGRLPNELALWSFGCFAGGDHQLAIFPDGSTQMFSCEEVSKAKSMLPCFKAVPKS